jgi:hypothetical protein
MRKSVLLAGSALAVAGLTTAGAQKAEAAEISLNMYMPFVIGAADSDNEAENQFGFGATDTEFWVTGKETLENGIDVAVKFQFNADQNSSPSANTDEIEIEISGSFGLLSLGHEDGPEDLMNRGPQVIKSWAFGSLGTNGTGSPVALSAIGATNNEANIDSSDAIKAAYYTPRWSGFQLGVAYSKESAIGYTATGQRPDSNTSGYAVGANYVNSFDGIDVALSGTYYAEDKDVGDVESADRYTIGAEVGYMGFTLAADWADGTASNGNDHQWWSVGGAYSTGPWSAHVTYEVGEADEFGSNGSGENTLIHTGVAYALGPGVTVGASLGFGNVDDSGLANDPDQDKDYTIFTTGVTVFF